MSNVKKTDKVIFYRCQNQTYTNLLINLIKHIIKKREDYNFIIYPYTLALNVEGKKRLRRESINDIGHDVCPLVVTSRTHDALLAREYRCM